MKTDLKRRFVFYEVLIMIYQEKKQIKGKKQGTTDEIITLRNLICIAELI